MTSGGTARAQVNIPLRPPASRLGQIPEESANLDRVTIELMVHGAFPWPSGQGIDEPFGRTRFNSQHGT